MTQPRWWLVLPLLLAASAGPAQAAEVRDKAGMFSAQAVQKAQADLDRIESKYSIPVTIETIESLKGRNIDDILPEHARAVDARGVYVLIARREGKTEAMSHKTYAKYLTRSRDLAIRNSFDNDFRKGDFDAGLARAVEKIDAVFAEAKAEAGGSLRPATAPVVPATRRVAVPSQVPAPIGRGANKESWGMGGILTIVIVLIGVFLVIRLLGALFSAGRGAGYGGPPRMGGPGYGGGGPGYGGGGPGYGGGGGGGGGGFMSSMFGGIGGALAGNWLYDQFSGRHHTPTTTTDQTAYDPNAAAAGAAPTEPAGPDWVGPNDGGADWGAGGGDAGGGGGGGDWGGGAGGGGGDWGGGGGGGGGGGDWGGGGGGGGDWGGGGGGGDDNGGGW